MDMDKILDKFNAPKVVERPQPQPQQPSLLPSGANNLPVSNTSNNNNFKTDPGMHAASLLNAPATGFSSTAVPFAMYTDTKVSVRMMNNYDAPRPSGMNQHFQSSFQDQSSNSFVFAASPTCFGDPQMGSSFGFNSSSTDFGGPRMGGFNNSSGTDGPFPGRRQPSFSSTSGSNSNDPWVDPWDELDELVLSDDDEIGDEAEYADRFANEDRDDPPPVNQRERNNMKSFDKFSRNPFDLSGNDDVGFGGNRSMDNPWIMPGNPFDIGPPNKQYRQTDNPFDPASVFQNESSDKPLGFARKGPSQSSSVKPTGVPLQEEDFEKLFRRERPFRPDERTVHAEEDVERSSFEPAVIDYGHGSVSNDVPEDDMSRYARRDVPEADEEGYRDMYPEDDDEDNNAVTIDYGHGTADIPLHPRDYYDDQKFGGRPFEEERAVIEYGDGEDGYQIRPARPNYEGRHEDEDPEDPLPVNQSERNNMKLFDNLRLSTLRQLVSPSTTTTSTTITTIVAETPVRTRQFLSREVKTRKRKWYSP